MTKYENVTVLGYHVVYLHDPSLPSFVSAFSYVSPEKFESPHDFYRREKIKFKHVESIRVTEENKDNFTNIFVPRPKEVVLPILCNSEVYEVVSVYFMDDKGDLYFFSRSNDIKFAKYFLNLNWQHVYRSVESPEERMRLEKLLSETRVVDDKFFPWESLLTIHVEDSEDYFEKLNDDLKTLISASARYLYIEGFFNGKNSLPFNAKELLGF